MDKIYSEKQHGNNKHKKLNPAQSVPAKSSTIAHKSLDDLNVTGDPSVLIRLTVQKKK